MNSFAKNLILGASFMAAASIPAAVSAQNKKTKIVLIENMDDTVGNGMKALDKLIGSLKNRDTIDHVYDDKIIFSWNEEGRQCDLMVKTGTPPSRIRPAENVLYVVDFVKTKTDEKGNIIYGNKRQTTRLGTSRKIMIEVINGEQYVYYKEYDNAKYVDITTPPNKTKVMRTESPDVFVPENAKKWHAYRRISARKLTLEIEKIRVLLDEGKRSYLQSKHHDNPKESIK